MGKKLSNANDSNADTQEEEKKQREKIGRNNRRDKDTMMTDNTDYNIDYRDSSDLEDFESEVITHENKIAKRKTTRNKNHLELEAEN